MEKEKLKAPVGQSPRDGKGEKVANKAEDVALVRKMLIANRYNVAKTGGMDAGLLKAIKAAQKKLQVPVPDGVIDPKGTTFKKLYPAFETWQKAEEKREAAAKAEAERPIMMLAVTYLNKVHHILPQDFDKYLKQVRMQAMALCKSYEKSVIHQRRAYMSVLDGYDLQQAFWKNIGSVVVASMTLMSPPDLRMVNTFDTAVRKLKSTIKGGTVAAIDEAITQAHAAQAACQDHLSGHLNRFQSAAKFVVGGAAVVGTLASAQFVVVAAPALVAVAGVTAVQAAIISGASLGVITGSVKELAAVPIGKSKGGLQAAGNIIAESAVGGLTAAIPTKMPAGFLDDVAVKIAPKAAKLFPKLPKEAVTKYIKQVLTSGSGEEAVKSALEQSLKLVQKSVNTGKVPSTKDFVEAVAEMTFAVLTRGLFSKLDKTSKAWAVKSGSKLADDMLPDVLNRMMKSGGPKLDSKMRTDILQEAHKAMYQNVLKEGYKTMLGFSGALDGSSKLLDQMSNAVLGSSSVRRDAENALKKAAKRRKVTL